MADSRNDIPMGWDDEIENDGEDFRVLPEGEYAFTVDNFTRGRFEGSAKMGACPKAELSIRIHDKDGDVTVNHNLFLNRKCEWALCAFFTAIGARKHGETLRMNWNAVKGAKGRCKVGVRKWTGNDGKEHEANEIIKFLEPEEKEAAASGQTENAPRRWTPGSFGN